MKELSRKVHVMSKALESQTGEGCNAVHPRAGRLPTIVGVSEEDEDEPAFPPIYNRARRGTMT